jgi:pyruvate formate lyase activating enzyme
VACDPVEKKPFYHFLPGSEVLSFGMLGCNFHCPFCQNWSISQTLRDSGAAVHPQPCEVAPLLRAGERHGVRAVASTYNEPLISSEWAVEIFRTAREHGLKTCMVSNGFAAVETLAYLEPWLDAINIDLKCFTDAGYRWLGGRLAPVLDTIRALWRKGVWVEVITLVVPEFNDSDAELRRIAEFLAGVSLDIPWHVSAYHRDYRMKGGAERTPVQTIERAMRIGREAGLRYIYAGNIRPGPTTGNTTCWRCGRVLIARSGYGVRHCDLEAGGLCPACGTPLPGIWS